MTFLTSDVAALRAALDLDPGNRTLADSLADALADAGAPEGYVALARLDRVPEHWKEGWMFWCHGLTPWRCRLPIDWWAEMYVYGRLVLSSRTRELAESLAAAAFDRLPADRRAAYLAGEWERG